jgi:hypothetical protein
MEKSPATAMLVKINGSVPVLSITTSDEVVFPKAVSPKSIVFPVSI